MAQPVRFQNSYQGHDPRTIFAVDDRSRQLRPISSGEAFTGAGYQFGQEQVGDPNAFAGYGVGPAISRADELAKLKAELNSYQQQTFQEQEQRRQRQASTLEQQIADSDKQTTDALAEFNELKTKLTSLQAPNLSQTYTDLRTQAGIPALESQFTGVRQTRRELPYTERAASGNAGVMTEGQLGANVEQKDIPLYIQEQNLIDRLSLASNFVENAMKFKESDFERSREGLTTALNLVGETINLSTSRVQNAINLYKSMAPEKLATNIDPKTGHLNITVQDPISGAYQTIDAGQVQSANVQELEMVQQLAQQYPDAGISLADSLVTAQSKLPKSRIYMDQVRPPQSSGGGGTSVSERLLLSQQGVLTKAGSTLESQRASSQDGYVNPDSYRAFKRDYLAAGGSAADFMQAYPVEVYISPTNRKGDLADKSKSSNSGLDPAVAAFLGY